MFRNSTEKLYLYALIDLNTPKKWQFSLYYCSCGTRLSPIKAIFSNFSLEEN